MVTGVEVDANDAVCGVTTYFGITFGCRAAVLTTGTFMNGQVGAPAGLTAVLRCIACWASHAAMLHAS